AAARKRAQDTRRSWIGRLGTTARTCCPVRPYVSICSHGWLDSQTAGHPDAHRNRMQPMRYVIPGGSGYIGSRLIELLVERGDTERVVDVDVRPPGVLWP